jgi:hypothetical protein
MKPGDVRKVRCRECATEFLLTLEPDVIRNREGKPLRFDQRPDMLLRVELFTEQPVVCCPFCRGAIREDES